MKVKIKNNSFEAIKVTGLPEQFGELKRFCGGKIHIEYATCSIDDYWLIKLDDDVRGRLVTVPDGFYILKVAELEHTTLFTLVSDCVMKEYFENEE